MIPAEVVAQLLVTHGARRPQPAVLPLTGDGGKPVKIDIAIANPRGACAPVDGTTIDGCWPLLLRRVTGADLPPNIDEQIMAECVIWPAAPELAKYVVRWPDLPKDIAMLVMAKIAMEAGRVIRPADDEKPPESIAEALAAHPTASWRRVRASKSEQLAIVIEPPSGPAWRMAKKSMVGAGAWKTIYELAVDRVKACSLIEGEPKSVIEVFDRWPGLAALMVPAIAALVGVAEEIELGEF